MRRSCAGDIAAFDVVHVLIDAMLNEREGL